MDVIKWQLNFVLYNFGLLVRTSGRSRKKMSNFVGFSGTNSQKKRPISREFRGNFRGHCFAEKRLVLRRFEKSFQ